MKTITLPIKDYIDLLIDQEKLSRLEEGGVDNWEWYSESLNIRGTMEDFIRNLKSEHKE